MDKTLQSSLMNWAENLAMYLVLPAWIGSGFLFFSETAPALVGKNFFFGLFLVMAQVVFGMILLTIWGFIKTNRATMGAKHITDAMIMALAPAVVILPSTYWELYVLLGVLLVNRVVLTLRARHIVKVPVVRTATVQANQSGATDEDSAVETIQYKAEVAAFTFESMAGMADLKEQMLSAAKESMFALPAGGANELTGKYRNGTLLYGEPGNGKTVMAEAMAGSLKLPIIKMSFGSVNSKWVGSTTENVVKLFKDARAQAPCVLFMDEVDSIISSRDKASSSDSEGPKTTNQILTELVNIRGTGVVVVMATNFIDRLDVAAVREGRVDFKILVPAPDAEARRAIINKAIFGSRQNIDVEASAIDQAVKRWDGFSAARISAVSDEVVRIVKKTGDVATYKTFQAAMRVMQGGQGVRIPDDTPTLEQIYMTEQPRRTLLGVAKRMESIEEIEKMGGSVPSGLLLAGPAGTGKTMAVRSLAKTTGWPLLTSSGADLMGDSAKIDELMIKAKNARPCIVFIDEADDVFSDRRAGSTYSASITNKLLTAMDGVGGKVRDILWVAAVNAPEVMDSAALRGGRFTEKAWFENPNQETAQLIIEQWMGVSAARFSVTATSSKISQMVKGQSPANIKEVLQQAVNSMVSRTLGTNSEQVVTLDDVTNAMEAVLT